MKGIQKKLIAGGVGIVVFAIAFYFLRKLSEQEIFIWGSVISFIGAALIYNNNSKAADDTAKDIIK